MQLHYITEQVLIGSIRRWANGGLGGNYRNKVGREDRPSFIKEVGTELPGRTTQPTSVDLNHIILKLPNTDSPRTHPG